MAFLRISRRGALSLLAAVAAVAAITVSPAQAASLTVTTLDDELNTDGDCSLREAIQAANTDTAVDACAAGSGADVISLPAGTYTIGITGSGEDANATGDFDLASDISIFGAGPAATIVDGADLDRVFHAVGGSIVQVAGLTVQNGGGVCRGGGVYNDGGDLTLNDVAISGNRTGLLCSGTGAGGGGILNTGTLAVTHSAVTGNVADLQGQGMSVMGGGGILNTGTLAVNDSVIAGNFFDFLGSGSFPFGGGGIFSTGTLAVDNSTVNGNDAFIQGGGIQSTGNLTVHDSTISDNRVTSDGGGLSVHGTATLENSAVSGNFAENRGAGIFGVDTLTLTNVTVSGNTTRHDPGGGLMVFGATTLRSVTISRNDAGSGADSIATWPTATVNVAGTIVADSPEADCESSTLMSQGYNLIETSGCIIGGPQTGDLEGLDPLVGSLADNGGPTLTHALLEGSPAIDAGSPSCPPPSTDQRAVARPQGLRCDIGAFELVQTVTVGIDVKPGGFPNSINTAKKGVIPVAVLSTSTFDAADVDPSTVCFGDTEDASQRDCTVAPGTKLKDVNGDAIVDLVLHFNTEQSGIDPGDTQACLTGELFDSTQIEGCDSIKAK